MYHVRRANSTTPCGASMLEILGTPTAAPHSTYSAPAPSGSPWSTWSMYLNSPTAHTVRSYFRINSSRSMSITSLTWKAETSDISDRGPRGRPPVQRTPRASDPERLASGNPGFRLGVLRLEFPGLRATTNPIGNATKNTFCGALCPGGWVRRLEMLHRLSDRPAVLGSTGQHSLDRQGLSEAQHGGGQAQILTHCRTRNTRSTT